VQIDFRVSRETRLHRTYGGGRAEAIHILENNPDEIDLVVSDIMMPKLNGLDFTSTNLIFSFHCDSLFGSSL
jgi:CheY-like chemotaxis protein